MSTINVDFIGEYKYDSDDEPAQEMLDAFAVNALFHVWPYWREYVQNACVRMRLPVPVIPMFRIEDVKLTWREREKGE